MAGGSKGETKISFRDELNHLLRATKRQDEAEAKQRMDNFHELMRMQAANPHLMTPEAVKKALKSFPKVDTTRFEMEIYQGDVPQIKWKIPKPTRAYFDWLIREPEKGNNIDLSNDAFYASLPPDNPYYRKRKFDTACEVKEKENVREESEVLIHGRKGGQKTKEETTKKRHTPECMPGSSNPSASRVLKENAFPPPSSATPRVNQQQQLRTLPSPAATTRERAPHSTTSTPVPCPFKKKNTTSKMAPISRSPSPCDENGRQNNNTCLEPLLSTTFIVPDGAPRKTSYQTIPEEEPSPKCDHHKMISSPAAASSRAEVASSSASSWSRPPHTFPTTTTTGKKECSKTTDQHAPIQRHEPSMTPQTEARDEPAYSSLTSRRPRRFPTTTTSSTTVETKEGSKTTGTQVAPALRHQNLAPNTCSARDEHVTSTCSSPTRCPPQIIDPFFDENDNPEHRGRAALRTPRKLHQKQLESFETPKSVTPTKSRGKYNLQPKHMDTSPKRRRVEEDKTATPPAPTTPVRSVTPVPTTPVHSQKYDHVKSRYLDHVTTEKNQKNEADEKRDGIMDNGSVTPTRNRGNGFKSRKRYQKTPPASAPKKYVVTPSTVRGGDENTENIDKKDIMFTSSEQGGKMDSGHDVKNVDVREKDHKKRNERPLSPRMGMEKHINDYTMNEDTISSVQQISQNCSIHVPPKVNVKAMMNRFEKGQVEKMRSRTPPPSPMPKNAAEVFLTPKRRSRTPPMPKNPPEALLTPKGRRRTPPPKINTAAPSSSAHAASASESSATSERRGEKREEKNRVMVANKKLSDEKEEGDEQNNWGFLNCVVSPPRKVLEKENLSDKNDKTPPTTQAKKGPQKQIWGEAKNLKGRCEKAPAGEKTRFRKTPPAPKNTYLAKERSRTPPSRKIMENHPISGCDSTAAAAAALITNDERPQKKGAEQDHDDNDECTDKAVVEHATSPLPSLSKDPKKPANANPLTLSTFKDYEAAQKKKPVKKPSQNTTPRDQMTKMKKLDARHSISATKMKKKMQTQMDTSQAVPAKKMQTQIETSQAVSGKKMQTQMETSQAVSGKKMQTQMETSQAVSAKNAESAKKDKSPVKKKVNERKKTPRSGNVIVRPTNSSRRRSPPREAPIIKESRYFVVVTENCGVTSDKMMEVGQGFFVGRRRDYDFEWNLGLLKEYRDLNRKLCKKDAVLPPPRGQNASQAEGWKNDQEKDRWFGRLRSESYRKKFNNGDAQTIFGLMPSVTPERVFPDRYAAVKWTEWTRDRVTRSEVKEYKRSVGHTKQFRLYMEDVVGLREKVRRAEMKKARAQRNVPRVAGNFLA